jgi:hypothetical protein
VESSLHATDARLHPLVAGAPHEYCRVEPDVVAATTEPLTPGAVGGASGVAVAVLLGAPQYVLHASMAKRYCWPLVRPPTTSSVASDVNPPPSTLTS